MNDLQETKKDEHFINSYINYFIYFILRFLNVGHEI